MACSSQTRCHRAANWYVEQADLALGEYFLSQLETTLGHLAHVPATGSTRHADIVSGLPTPLRFFPVSGFERHLIYYLDLPTHVDVIRIWSASRGLDALMEEPVEKKDDDIE